MKHVVHVVKQFQVRFGRKNYQGTCKPSGSETNVEVQITAVSFSFCSRPTAERPETTNTLRVILSDPLRRPHREIEDNDYVECLNLEFL